jgi:hypothetical protein
MITRETLCLQFILRPVDLNTKLGKSKQKKYYTEIILFWIIETEDYLVESLKLRNIKWCFTVKCLPQTFQV